jgi:hypothetical protein
VPLKSPDLSVYGRTLFPLPLKRRYQEKKRQEQRKQEEQVDIVKGGYRGGENVPIWAEGVLYLEITSLLFWVKFKTGEAIFAVVISFCRTVCVERPP